MNTNTTTYGQWKDIYTIKRVGAEVEHSASNFRAKQDYHKFVVMARVLLATALRATEDTYLIQLSEFIDRFCPSNDSAAEHFIAGTCSILLNGETGHLSRGNWYSANTCFGIFDSEADRQWAIWWTVYNVKTAMHSPESDPANTAQKLVDAVGSLFSRHGKYGKTNTEALEVMKLAEEYIRDFSDVRFCIGTV